MIDARSRGSCISPSMTTTNHEVLPWIRQHFAGVDLGDARRVKRVQRMLAAAVARPAGRISEVFTTGAERQAAYDFLEHDQVSADSIRKSVGRACARACAKETEVMIALDGTSLTLKDTTSAKGFGSVGTYTAGASGLKVITSLALSTNGTPMGVPALVFWARQQPEDAGARRRYRNAGERESRYWRDAVDEVSDHFRREAPDTKLHFIADREADASLLMLHIITAGHGFTIRANGTRKARSNGCKTDLYKALRRTRCRGAMTVKVKGTSKRTARTARLVVRATTVEVLLRDRHTKHTTPQVLSVVWAREHGTCPDGEEAIEWLLYTTAPVHTARDAIDRVDTYSKRWRIEDFHRTWKSGACRVEETQLRSYGAVVKWASILAVVAARAEHLRHVARTSPEVAATTELSEAEIEALIILKRHEKKKTEDVPNDVPTIAKAVRWIADLGGYIGGKSSRPPGATVIMRGLERIAIVEATVAELRTTGKMR